VTSPDRRELKSSHATASTTARRPLKALPVATETAPGHLKAATADWWLSVVTSYDLEPHHVRLLTLAAEAWDRAEQAREQLAVDGITYLDRFRAPRKHPAVSIEENARLAFARLVRELDLEGDPLPTPRPPRRRG
jgi:phage terminase small subunit